MRRDLICLTSERSVPWGAETSTEGRERRDKEKENERMRERMREREREREWACR